MNEIDREVFDGSNIFKEYYKELVFENIEDDKRIDYKSLSMDLVEKHAPGFKYEGHELIGINYGEFKKSLSILVKRITG